MSTRRGYVRAVLLAAGSAWLSGCYAYHPVERPALGSTVRVHVPVVSAINRPNAPAGSEAIEGTLVRWGDTLALATLTRREFGAYREIVKYDTLRLAVDQTSSVELREFSPRRSIVLGSMIAVGAGAAAILAFNASRDGGQNPDGDGGDPPALSLSRSLLTAAWGLLAR